MVGPRRRPLEPESLTRLRDQLGRLPRPPRRGGIVLDPDLRRRREDLLDRVLGRRIDLDGAVPLVLLPVRVECRSTADGTRLRVRIFPDTVHVESLAEGLTADEVTAGQVYWSAVWAGADPATPAVWGVLQEAVGVRRAAWVAEALRPENLDERPGGTPAFPTPAEHTEEPGVVRTLPDRFYVRIEQDGAEPVTVAGRVVPDEVPVGLTTQDELTPVTLDEHDLPPLDATLRWLVDYDEAVALGLGVTVTLPVAGQDVERLVVYGVRASVDAEASASLLTGLLHEHRYADGAEFVAQGTPTNNTESARTSWSRRTPPGPPRLDPGQAPSADGNAAVLAGALGIPVDAVAPLAGATVPEQGRARAFAEALWETTWADALEVITEAGRNDPDHRLDGAVLDAIHDHWVGHVRGRGPVPAIRLGRQPYGLLPVLTTRDGAYHPVRGDRAETQVVPFVARQRGLWEDAAGDVPTVMDGALDEVVPEILGTAGVLRGLRVRTELQADVMMSMATDPNLQEVIKGQQALDTAVRLLSGIDDDQLDASGRLTGKGTRTLALPLVHDSDIAFIENLLATPRASAKPVSVLQVLLAHADAVTQHAVDRVAPRELLTDGLTVAVQESAVDLDRELVLRGLEAVQAEAWDDPLLVEASEQIERAAEGRFDRRTLTATAPYAALAAPTWAQQLAGDEPSVAVLRQAEGMLLVSELFRAGRRRGAFLDALAVIATVTDLEDRRLLLGETLDCTSHRLDAWLTSAASRRLADLRAVRPTGCHLGAWGVLHRIRLRPPEDGGTVDGRPVLHDPGDGGFVHAPGLTHAATAGVLRSGRLTQRRGDPDAPTLDIDLSSTRVRDALGILEGMRHGQSLSALLGYRLERRLHDRSGGPDGLELDRFVYVLRTLAPLRAGKLTDPGAPAEESLAASDVVDGLRLMEIADGAISARLDSGPADQTYIDAWVPPSAAERTAVLAAVHELEQTHDAVADLLLAESVHQLVSGNPARASATLDVLGAGESPPPEPEVVLQPRSGVALSHRVGVLVPGDATAGGGWAATPRALADPRLEAWAASVLGAATDLPLTADGGPTLADTGLGALDVVWDSDSDTVATSTLLTRVRRALPGVEPDPVTLAPVWEVAVLARGLLTASRPLTPTDTGSRPTTPASPDPGQRVPDAAEHVARAGAARDGLLAAVATADATALLPYGVRPTVAGGPPITPDEQAFADQALLDEGTQRAGRAGTLLTRAATAGTSPGAAVELARQALEAVFGPGFATVPLLLPVAADVWSEVTGVGAVTARSGSDIRPWLVRAGAVRASTAAYGELVVVREALSRSTIRHRVVQTPPGGYATWVGLPFPGTRPPERPVTALVAEVVGGAAADLAGPVAGLVVDEWTEVVPQRLERHDPAQPDAPPELVDVATTGIAVHANGPGARPPQTILLAMTPDGGRWTSDRVVDVLDEALSLARLRGVTLPMVPTAGQFLPALYFRDWSLQGEPVIQWHELAQTSFSVSEALTFLEVDP